LILEYEEIITSCMFMDGRKTYISAQLYNMDVWIHAAVNYDEIKYRGVSWSTMTPYIREQFKFHIEQFILSSGRILPDGSSDGIPSDGYYKVVLETMRQQIQ
jgi:hypothetical protein